MAAPALRAGDQQAHQGRHQEGQRSSSTRPPSLFALVETSLGSAASSARRPLGKITAGAGFTEGGGDFGAGPSISLTAPVEIIVEP